MTDYFNARERNILFRRFDELTPKLRGRGHAVNGHELVGHLNYSLRQLCGLAPAKRRSSIFHRTVWKWLVFYLIPWPERMPTSKDSISRFIGDTPLSTFADDHATFVSLLQTFETQWREGSLPPHPTFGTLSESEWGKYLFLHLDFHLTAFGIHGDYRAPK